MSDREERQPNPLFEERNENLPVIPKQTVGGEVFCEYRAADDDRWQPFKNVLAEVFGWSTCDGKRVTEELAKVLSVERDMTLADLRTALSNYRDSEWKSGPIHFVAHIGSYRCGPLGRYGRNFDAVASAAKPMNFEDVADVEDMLQNDDIPF